MSQRTDGEDFLGWAPARALDFDSSAPFSIWPERSIVKPAPAASVPERSDPTVPPRRQQQQSRPTSTPARSQQQRPAATAPRGPQRQSPPATTQSWTTPSTPGIHAAQARRSAPGSRSRRPTPLLFLASMVVAAFLLLFTLAGAGLDGSGLNPIAIFTGIAAFSVARAAWRMRPR